MKIGAEKINKTGAQLTNIASRIKNRIDDIRGQGDQFKV
jgi:hypothetical protein